MACDTAIIKLSIKDYHSLITDIKTASVATNSFKLDTLKIGNKLYVDRELTLKEISNSYLNYTWIINPVNDRHRYDLGTSFISFVATKDVTVFIAYDNNFLKLMPKWLKELRDTGNKITDDANNSFRIYSKNFNKGEIVLGNNTTEVNLLRLMYLIFIKEQNTQIISKMASCFIL